MKVGLQLYTVREPFQSDPETTLQKVAEAGYKYLEVFTHNSTVEAGVFGLPAKKLKHMAEQHGITIISAHIGADDDWALVNDTAQMDKIIAYNAELGCQNLVLSAQYFTSLENVYANCDIFNSLGKRCRSASLSFLYHNHFWDFQEIEGKVIMDLLVEKTDPDLVGVQVDAYWIKRGLVDPVEVVHRYKHRVKSLHQKDFPRERMAQLDIWQYLNKDKLVTPPDVQKVIKPEDFTEIGTGILDIQGLINAGNAYSVSCVFLEQDHSMHDPFTSIKISMENYRKMQGIEFE